MGAEARHGSVVEGRSLSSSSRLNAIERGKRMGAKKPTPRPCAVCKTIFVPAKESSKKPSRFCSDKCRSRSWREEQRPNVRLDRVELAIAELAARVMALEERGR